MNPEIAYEWQTDLARALGRGEDDPAWQWLLSRVRSANLATTTGKPQPFFWMGDVYRTQRKILEEGAKSTSSASVIYDFQAVPDPTFGADDLVGVIDPDRLADSAVVATDPKRGEGDQGAPEALLMENTAFMKMTAARLSAAPTFYVTPEMVDMLDYAAHGLDETDFMPAYGTYPAGFVALAKPLLLPYADGHFQRVDAFAWNIVGDVCTDFGKDGQAGAVFQFANRAVDLDDQFRSAARPWWPSERAWRDSPNAMCNMVERFVTNTPTGTATETVATDYDRAEVVRRMLDANERPTLHLDTLRATSPGAEVGRFQPYLAAFWLLLTQQITAPRKRDVSEHATRRASKVSANAHTSGRTSTVTVVDLRAREGATGTGDGERSLDHRHPVGGYWRWQPYGPAGRLRKRIFVADYIRGPADAPLRVKPRVHRV